MECGFIFLVRLFKGDLCSSCMYIPFSVRCCLLSHCLVIQIRWFILSLQVISDSIMDRIMTSLRQLRALALCYCLGDISISSFKFSLPNLRKLRLERVTPWMTNDDLVILTQHCANLVELSLLGCTLLNAGQ